MTTNGTYHVIIYYTDAL